MILKLIRNHLLQIIDDIDSGNTNLNSEEAEELLNIINKLTNNKEDFSKYSAANYLKISRATFDNYISEGKIPKGVKKQGFKELRWYKKDLDEFKKTYKSNTQS